jgi:cytochrome c-type biogenesis protein CcmH/NrfF
MSQGRPTLSRRHFLLLGAAGAAGSLVGQPLAAASWLQAPQDTLAGRGATGTLRDPNAVGRPRQPTSIRGDEAEIQAIEQRLACNCGCTLDVFTCRTTDFTCTYSPKLHQEVLALRDEGKTAREILGAFVDKYGEKALMAPKPEGVINLTGYFLPGALIAAAGAGLALFITRRKATIAAVTAPTAPGSPLEVHASPEELDRLRRALNDIEA